MKYPSSRCLVGYFELTENRARGIDSLVEVCLSLDLCIILSKVLKGSIIEVKDAIAEYHFIFGLNLLR